MSELQIGLIIIGLIAVVAVYVFNRLQENKYRRRAERAFNQRHTDVLLEPRHSGAERGKSGFSMDVQQRVEPQFGSAPAPEATPGEEILSVHAEPVAASQPNTAAPSAGGREAPIAPPPPKEVVAPPSIPMVRADVKSTAPESIIDYVAAIEALDPIPAVRIAGLRGKLAEIGKPVQCAAYNASTTTWENAAAGKAGAAGESSYAKIRCAVQLANRDGAISEAQLRAFRDAITDFAGQNRADFECPPVQPALTAARKLDQFCIDADIAIGVNLISDQKPFSGTKIRALAEATGMKLEPDGAFHLLNEHGITLFTLSNRESSPFYPEQIKNMATRGITLLLDVPRVADGPRVFNQMIHLGRGLANALGGTLVDDNRRTLSEPEFEAIRRQMAAVRAAMDAQKISAGGADALRLFS